jgi:hypothetical protein
MSALPPKADIAERDRHVRFLPIADIDVSLRGRTKGRSLVPFVRQFFQIHGEGRFAILFRLTIVSLPRPPAAPA